MIVDVIENKKYKIFFICLGFDSEISKILMKRLIIFLLDRINIENNIITEGSKTESPDIKDSMVEVNFSQIVTKENEITGGTKKVAIANICKINGLRSISKSKNITAKTKIGAHKRKNKKNKSTIKGKYFFFCNAFL